MTGGLRDSEWSTKRSSCIVNKGRGYEERSWSLDIDNNKTEVLTPPPKDFRVKVTLPRSFEFV